MKRYLKPCLTCFVLMVLLAHFGCKKTDSAAPITAYNNIKVFDDTLADIRNQSVHIADGNGILYMTYGVHSTNNGVDFNSFNFVTDNIYYANLLATNYEGNLIWKHKLPTGRIVGDILVLDDGTLILASYKTFDNWYPQTTSYIYLVHFDKSGQKILEDSVSFTNSAINGFVSVYLSRSINNNLIISGSVGNNDAAGVEVPFISEFDLNFNLLWERTTFEPLPLQNYERIGSFSKGLKTPDGNYLFIRDFPNFISSSNVDTALQVVKTNSTGDIIWSKPFNPGWQCSTSDFIQNAKGNYQFSFTTGTLVGYTSRVYEVNANGDSLSSAMLSKDDIKMNYALVPKDNGGVFAIMNNYSDEYIAAGSIPNGNYPVFDITNASYVNLDAQLQMVSGGLFQSKTSDFFRASCKLPTGQIACFGLIKSIGKSYYKPALLILK